MSEVDAVLFVNEAFYDAFRRRDLATMELLWAREAPSVCIHPGMRALVSRRAIMDSWEDILSSQGAPDIRCRDSRAMIMGEVAAVVCYELLGGRVLVATNLFHKEGGGWKLVLHQAGPCAEPPSVWPEGLESDTLQ